MTSAPWLAGPRERSADRCLCERHTPLHRRRRAQGRKLLRVFSVARLSRAGQGTDRHADLQELRSIAKASGRANPSMLSEGNETGTSSDLQVYIVAGVGFEPT